MWQRPSVRLLPFTALVVAVGVLAVSSGLSAPSGHTAQPWATGTVAAPQASAAVSNSSGPNLTLLAGFAETPFAWTLNFPLNFTVPTGTTTVLYVWSLAGNFSAYVPPTLPNGMAVASSIGFAGMAIGNLSAGTYQTNLSYPGWVNTVTIAVYGVSGNLSTTYQFSQIDERNQQNLQPYGVNLTLPVGGSEYLGVEATGGTFPVNNTSLTLVDEQTEALRGGETGLIGRQSSNVLSFTTVAVGSGIVGVAIDANVSTEAAPLSVSLLASYSLSFGSWNASFPMPFTVPAGISTVVYLWAIGGNYSAFSPPDLPAGMTVAASINYSGIAIGNLTPGTYFTNVSYAGYANYGSVAVYGIAGGGNAVYRFGSQAVPNPGYPNVTVHPNTTLPAGAAEYLGVEMTGGTVAVTDSSFTEVDEVAWALDGGVTGVIGRQSTDNVSFATNALSSGVVAVGIYPGNASNETAVTFVASGLPAGSAWTLVTGGAARSTGRASLRIEAPQGVTPYLIEGPAGYRVTGMAPSGTLEVGGTPLSETVIFEKAKTVTVTFREKGLAAGKEWCVRLQGWSRCSTSTSVPFPDLTPGTYAYSLVPVPLYTESAKAGRAAIGPAGALDVSRSEVVRVAFSTQAPVTFRETGLPVGSSWTVTIHGVKYASTNSTIVVNLANGAVGYKVGGPKGYSARAGTVHVGAEPTSVGVVFRHRG